jgi:hypothetical protein
MEMANPRRPLIGAIFSIILGATLVKVGDNTAHHHLGELQNETYCNMFNRHCLIK